MELLRAKLFTLQLEEQNDEISSRRKLQVPRLHSSSCSERGGHEGIQHSHAQKWTVGFWEIAHAAVSRRPSLSLARVVVARFPHTFSPLCILWCSIQVGSGSRSEKIRTYNYKDNRVSDHRAKANFDLNGFMSGGIKPAVDTLLAMEQQELLQELAGEFSSI
jgi:hypothetical protein